MKEEKEGWKSGISGGGGGSWDVNGEELSDGKRCV